MKLPKKIFRPPVGQGRSRGFTLVETLVAFTILGVFVATSFQAFSVGMSANVRTGEYAKAQILAKSKLETLSASDVLAPGENSGWVTLDDGAQTFRWRARIENDRQETTDSLAPLLAVVEVTWDSEGPVSAPRTFELHALLISKNP